MGILASCDETVIEKISTKQLLALSFFILLNFIFQHYTKSTTIT